MSEEQSRIVMGTISIKTRFPLHSNTDIFVGEKRIMGREVRCTSFFPCYLLVDLEGNSLQYYDVPLIMN